LKTIRMTAVSALFRKIWRFIWILWYCM